ncbi:MAG: hypothetical protein IT364_07910, partial [Candidatus Hydrogenedentes bacterium]|nr:hypothetical protein [Candidatus Hydrogenedentota bacterium]
SLNEHSEAWDINEAGQIVGETNTLGNTIHPFLWMPDEPNGTTGTLHDMGAPASDWAGAWQINESGQVTGWSALPGPDEWRPFVWTPDDPNGTAGSYVHLGTLGGVGAETYAINDLGQTAGYSVAPDSDFYHAILWTPETPNGDTGTMYDLGTLGGSESEARGINNFGVAVGEAALEGDEEKHAFRWVPTTPNGSTGEMQDLGTLGGDASIAYSITDADEIVGRSTTRDGENAAFLWTEDCGMIDLNKRLRASCRYNSRTGKGWKITIARDINSQGWIVGSGTLDGGDLRAVLLRPIAED